MKSILLLADSQLLFLKNEKQEYYLRYFIGDKLDELSKAAYVGASNGDEEVFYELFKDAMSLVEITDCKMISSAFNAEDKEFLEQADLILLAGGDVNLGLKVFKETGMEKVLQQKYQEGTIMIGVSAGAIQLGWQSHDEGKDAEGKPLEGLRFVPFIPLIHKDYKEMQEVEGILKKSGTMKKAYVIAPGAGMIYHPDDTLEAIRKPVNEYILKDDELSHTVILANI